MSRKQALPVTDTLARVANPAALPSLRERVVRAGSFHLGAHLIGQALRLVSNLILARLLSPEVFGVMALATVIQIVISLFADIGLRQTVIQSPRGDSRAMLDTAWTLQIARGLMIWLTCCAIAFALALGWFPTESVYGAAELPGVIVGMSFAAVIMGFQSTKVFTADRTLNAQRVVLIELVAQLCGLTVMVVLAYATRSIWSIVAGALTTAALSTTLSHVWLAGLTNRLGWDRSALREFLAYGRWVLLSTLLYMLAANVDRLLLGRWIDASTLGLYSIAFTLAAMVETMMSRVTSAVAMPALSEVARTDSLRLRTTYFRLRWPIDLVFLLASGFLWVFGGQLIDLMYDDRYKSAGSMLEILSLSLVFSRFNLSGCLYLAIGKPEYLIWINLVRLATICILFPTGHAFFGLNGALFAVVLSIASTLPVFYWFNARHHLNDWWFEFFVMMSWPLGCLVGFLAKWTLES